MIDLQSRLNELVDRFDVPGASVAVLHDGDIDLASTGVASIGTGRPVTNETIFAIGSITKVFTATLMMQLVESGLVDLDLPVRDYLPDLQLASKEQTERVTVRQLLTHTSGIAGDHIHDTGAGSDALEHYVKSLASLPELHPPGVLFSYSNSAVILAGYLLEQLTGTTWPDLIRERLIELLGLDSMVVFREEAERRPIVSPHNRDDNGRPVAGDMWLEFHAGASAGFTPYASAADVVRFAQLHLDQGRSTNGGPLLSPESFAAMQQVQVSHLPSGSLDNTVWGIGWGLHQYVHERGLGHNGGTSAMLRVLPDRGFAVAVLTNISGGIRMGGQLIAEIIGDRFGIERAPVPPVLEATHEQLRPFVGTYQHLDYTVTIDTGENGLRLSTSSRHGRPSAAIPLLRTGPTSFVAEFADRGWSRTGFVVPSKGEQADYFHMGLRAYKRVS